MPFFVSQQPARPAETPLPEAVQYVTPFELSDHHERYVGRTISMIGDVDDAEVQKFVADTPAMAEKVRDFKGRAIVIASSVTGPDGEDLTVNGGKEPSWLRPRPSEPSGASVAAHRT